MESFIYSMSKAYKKIDPTVLQSKSNKTLRKMQKFLDPDTPIIWKSWKKILIRVDTEDLEQIGKLILMIGLLQSQKKETGSWSNQNNFNKKLWEIKCSSKTSIMEKLKKLLVRKKKSIKPYCHQLKQKWHFLNKSDKDEN